MSTTMSARRAKERSGGLAGPKFASKSFKPITPIPISDKRISSGKENGSGPISKAQKPTIRPMTRVDNGGRDGGRARWSSSSASAPRGRSPSPSEFSRMVSDIRKDRRVSVDRALSCAGKPKKGFADLGASGVRVSRDGKEEGKIGVISEKMSKLCEVLDVKVIPSEKSVNGVRVLGNQNEKNNLSLNGVEGNSKESGKKARGEKVKLGDLDLMSVKGVDLEEKPVKVVEIGKEEGFGGGRGGNSYPSKLHEKLAFLEGKVKRIASDIKKTKEMLDMNNPDASKVILSDIQVKISGIEKAIGCVAGDSDAKKSSSKSNELGDQNANMSSLKSSELGDLNTKMVENGQREQVDNGKSSVKGLSSDELEARLFPHHKLLRSRTTTTSKAPSGNSQSVESHVGESGCETKVDDKALSPVDENPIAVEFLASLNKEKSKVTMRERHASLECFQVEEADGVHTAAGGNSSDVMIQKDNVELILTTDETLDEFDDQENRQMTIDDETEENCIYQLNEIGCKTSTGGWFVSEGESVLLAHDDGSCTFYDIVNNEVLVFCLKVISIFSEGKQRKFWLVLPLMCYHIN